MPTQKKSVAIIGAGASGVILASRFAKESGNFEKIYLVDRSGDYGRGLAYSTDDLHHLLNVPAAKMSAFPEDPLHFFRWIKDRSLVNEDSFVPRKIYGEYLHGLLPIEKVEWISGNAIHVEETSSSRRKYRIQIEGRDSIEADLIILALGNLPSGQIHGAIKEIINEPGYVDQVWRSNLVKRVSSSSRILVVGTGLSMVDIVLTLKSNGHCGNILAISRRGLLPLVHQLSNDLYTLPNDIKNKKLSLRSLFSIIRKEIEMERQRGLDWRPVIDSLRSVTSEIWEGLTVSEKKRFLRHLRPFWDVHRHRVAPEIDDKLRKLFRSKELQVLAGRIVAFKKIETGIQAVFKRRGSGKELTEEFDFVINCSGTDCDFRRMEDPLLKSLMLQGLISADELGLGLAVSQSGAVLKKGGESSNSIFVMGPLRKGTLWETTAIPEIRVQAKELADLILQQSN